MSLNWDITRCTDSGAITPNEKNGAEGAKTYKLIWLMLSIGMREISKSNFVEFFARVEAYEKRFGACRRLFEKSDLIDVYFTRDDIERRIGLTTNCSHIATRVWWAKWKKEVAAEEAAAKKLAAQRAASQA